MEKVKEQTREINEKKEKEKEGTKEKGGGNDMKVIKRLSSHQ